MFIATDQLSSTLVQIGRVFPLAHLAQGLQTALAEGHAHLSGRNLAVLGIWTLVGLVVAARRFDWRPRAAHA